MLNNKDGQLIDTIIKHEGNEQFAYKDSLGYLTIGIGRCIDKAIGEGLSAAERLYLLQNDIENCRETLARCRFYQMENNVVRKDALVELCFNMGISHLLKFVKMITAFEKQDYKQASFELSNSTWATQVSKDRVDNIRYRIENGQYP